jgi:hypothetical protein
MTATERPIPSRWYSVNRIGAATLCCDGDDATEVSARFDRLFPRDAPHVAVQLAPARTLDAAPADPVMSADRFVVVKASGSRFAYVNDTQEGRTVKRYDILKGTGRRNGWEAAKAHAESLNADLAKEQSRGR